MGISKSVIVWAVLDGEQPGKFTVKGTRFNYKPLKILSGPVSRMKSSRSRFVHVGYTNLKLKVLRGFLSLERAQNLAASLEERRHEKYPNAHFYTYMIQDPHKKGPYTYTDKDNVTWIFSHKPIYVGKGSGSRVYHHASRNEHPELKSKLTKISRKGKEPIYKIIQQDLTDDQSLSLESKLVDCIGRRCQKTGPLFNRAGGGGGLTGYTFSESHRRKLREKALKRAPMSQEIRDKISKTKSGRTLSEEHKRKISESGKGRIVSEETRLKISKKHQGKTLSKEHLAKLQAASRALKRGPYSEEHRAAISRAKKGKKRPPFSEEWKRKMSESQRRRHANS